MDRNSPAVLGPVETTVRRLAWMPLQDEPMAVRADLLSEAQAQKNHGQTLQRLAERGGLGLDEAACLAARISFRPMGAATAMAVLRDAALGKYRDA